MTKQVLAAEIFNNVPEDFVPRLPVDELPTESVQQVAIV
jgi:hypothetical protein